MTKNDFQKLSGLDFEKMSKADLSKLVSQQGKTANKRYERIKEDPESAKNAVSAIDRSGGKFSAKGKSKHQLIKEAKRIQGFNKAKTGTIQGARKVHEATQKQVTGKTGRQAQREAEAEAKQEIKRARKKAGKTDKLNKKELAKVKAAGRKAKKKVEKDTKSAVKKFEKKKQKQQIKDRGAYYYAKPDGKGAGATGEDTDMSKWMSTTEAYTGDKVQKMMNKEIEYQKNESPLELAGKNNESDDDFVVAEDNPFI